MARPFGMTFSFVDATDLAAVEAAFTPKTKLVWVESPSNPLLKISDIRALAKLAHAKGDKVAGIYDRSQHVPERAAMMQAWADYLDSLRAGGEGAC